MMTTTRPPSPDREASAAPEALRAEIENERALRRHAEERFGKERLQRQTVEANARHLEAGKAAG